MMHFKRLLGAGAAGLLALTVFGFSTDADAQTTVHRNGPTPDYHVVDQGDTMWDLSGAYYGDNYLWPRVWSYNAHVTNPHWIYPGDIVYLRAPSAGVDPTPAQPSAAPSSGSLQLATAGFITQEKVEYAGRIVGSPKEANMVSDLDTVWLGLGDEAYTDEEREDMDEEELRKMKAAEPVVGKRYVVVRETDELSNEDGDAIGYKYHVVGIVEITEVSEKYYESAIVKETWREMYRGDYLVPMERQLKSTSPVQSDKDMVAQIVDSIKKIRFFGEHHFVFVNKGADDGIRNGNRFFVYQRKEGLDFPGEEAEEKIPWRRVGQVMVIDVRKAYSLAIVTNSTREIVLGDRLEMYKGY